MSVHKFSLQRLGWFLFIGSVRYLPGIAVDQLNPEMTGIRPKLQKPRDPARDFIIEEESSKGLPGAVNLIGIESPGLTASFAIARYVRELVASLA